MMRDDAKQDPGRNLTTVQARAEFDPCDLTIWLGRLLRQGLGLALPALILKLDALGKADLPPQWRVAVLQMLKGPVLTAAASLPKPVGGRHAGGGAGLSLEQRLLLLTQANLTQAIVDLCRPEFSEAADADAARYWAIGNLWAFNERQIRYGIDWGVPWPPGTWQRLYDLYTLLTERGHLTVLRTSELDQHDTDLMESANFDPTNAFKRLLLLGIASQSKPCLWDDREMYERLTQWAEDTRLDDPSLHVWQIGVYALEVGRDAPPRPHPGLLEDRFHGFVVVPPRSFLVCIGRGPAREGPGLRPF
jgi:hypothetical protein